MKRNLTDEEKRNILDAVFTPLDNAKPERSHFEDLIPEKVCMDRGHSPPTHMVIPQGKIYVHVCPSCGQVQRIIPTQITC